MTIGHPRHFVISHGCHIDETKKIKIETLHLLPPHCELITCPINIWLWFFTHKIQSNNLWLKSHMNYHWNNMCKCNGKLMCITTCTYGW